MFGVDIHGVTEIAAEMFEHGDFSAVQIRIEARGKPCSVTLYLQGPDHAVEAEALVLGINGANVGAFAGEGTPCA